MPASRFHDGHSGATHIVRVLVFGRELRIAGEDDATLAVWKLAQVKTAPELDPDGAVTLTARDLAGVLLVDDSAELELLRHAGIKLPGHKAWTNLHWVAVGAALACTVGLGLLAVTTLPRWLAAAIPISWERRLGEPAEALMTASSTRCSGKEGQMALDRLVGRLLTAGDIQMPVTLSVLDDGLVNAFTLPGGHILVMRGLITHADDGAMLAGVIAHELGHVAHRDSTTLLLRAMGFSLLLHAIGLGDAGGTAAAGATNLMSLAYSRAAETAADDTAVTLLAKAGLRADGLSRFFARMEHLGAVIPGQGAGEQPKPTPDRRAGAMLSWFATHPPSEARRERTARAETGEMPFTEAEWRAIKTMCAKK